MIGQILGHYRIVEKIGAGGMGEVYRAHDEHLQREVALKVLPTGTLADEPARRRFRREALSLSKLNHPNIAMVFDFDTQEGVDFLVMELVPGEALNQRLKTGALKEKEVLSLGAQLAEGLAAAHAQGVVHRDLKPGNLMITPEGRLKILDFGLAKLLGPSADPDVTRSLTETRAVGTLPYMSPEQLQGEPADARSDIYAAGTALYEMATGRRPFQETLSTALVNDIIHTPPPPPGRLNPKLPPKLEDIILKCLEKEPENRYQSAKEVGVDLRRLGAPKAIAAEQAAPTARGTWIRIKWAAVIVAVVTAAVVAVWNAGGWRQSVAGGAGSRHIQSLAVLPLENLSHDPEQDYFADGMTEELITRLARMHALRVTSRTSVMQYRGTKKSIPEIGRELNVNAVIEGSVLRSGNRVRITAQLIQADTDTHLWAESYERELSDVLTLQNEVARTIADEIRAELTPEEQGRLVVARPVNSEAYQLYLHGRYYWNRRDAASIRKALDYFQQTIEKDPNYALAYAGLGDAYQFLGDLPEQEVFAKCTAAYKKAAELDTSLAEPHAGLGLLLFSHTYEWTNSEQEFRRAIELNPGYASAHQWYSNLLSLLGRKEDARAEIQKAVQLDPLSPIINTTVGYRLADDERYDDAITQYRKVLEINPTFWTAHYGLGNAYLRKGMIKEAIAESRTAQMLRGFKPNKVDREAKALSEAYDKTGPRGYWQKRLELALMDFKRDQLTELSEVSRYDIASYYAMLGKKEQAFEWLDQSYTAREPELGSVKTDPAFKDLRPDPRFQELMRRIGLPP